MGISRFNNLKEKINDSTIELFGNKRVMVFDCKSIIDYSEEVIVLDLGAQRLKITGVNLVADSFVFGQTDITGTVFSVEFV